jgi:hypothetical protein
VDEGGARVAREPTFFYLPHCEVALCEALLAANGAAGPAASGAGPLPDAGNTVAGDEAMREGLGAMESESERAGAERSAGELDSGAAASAASGGGGGGGLAYLAILGNSFATYRDR